MAKKYYADLNRKYRNVETDWNECLRVRKEIGGLHFKAFETYEEAKAYLEGPKLYNSITKETISYDDMVKERNETIMEEAYIGSDEVGKGEPLRQLYVISTYIKKEMAPRIIDMGAGKDSKKFQDIDAPAVSEIGRKLTDFRSFSDCKNGIYKNEEYGLTFCVCGISNREYNQWKETQNANKILSILHNKANYMLYEALKEDGIDVKNIIIDNFMGENYDLFAGRYIVGEEKKIMDLDATVRFVIGAESQFPAVGCASVIGSYVEKLWQDKLREEVEKAGGDRKFLHFGNEREACKRAYAHLEEIFGSLDDDRVQLKHTLYYNEYMEQR